MSTYHRRYLNQPDGYGDDGASSPLGVRPGVKALLIANVAVFVVQVGFNVAHSRFFEDFFGLNFRAFLETPYLTLYQLVSYQFLHDVTQLFHLLFNMLALWVFGNGVHDRLGKRRFLALYLAGGVFGGLAWLSSSWLTGQTSILIGASGSVYTIMVYFAILYPNAPIIFFIVRMKVKWLVTIFVGLDVYRVLLVENSVVAGSAHLGGAAFGALAYFVLPRLHGVTSKFRRNVSRKAEQRERRHRRETQMRVDELLDKIRDEGMSSLTEKERKFLTQASKRL